MTDSNELTLKVDGKALAGWTQISVTRSMVALPNSFQLVATEKSPVYQDASFIQKGNACTVSLGSDLVITGYCDQVMPGYSEGAHDVIVVGRGKCQDLTDCSAEWKGCQVSGSNALEIAQKLCKPYGLTASSKAAAGPTVPQFNINVGETAVEVIELVTRHAGLLYYEGTDGNLVLAALGSDRAGSGIVEGKNIQAARLTGSAAQLYSEYVCSLLSISTSPIFVDWDGLFYFTAKDPNVKRHRRLVIVAEGVEGGQELAKTRALWEAARRAGHGQALTVTVDSWRDARGKLWTPNTLVPIDAPRLGLKGQTWALAQVTYKADLGSGSTAELLLMPKESFQPEPIRLQPVIGGLVTNSQTTKQATPGS